MLVERIITYKCVNVWYYIKIAGLFLILIHLFINKADYNKFSTAVSTTFHSFLTDSHQGCNKIYLEEKNKTPIKCNSNYCPNISLFFTASFTSFGFEKFIGKKLSDRFFPYDDAPYCSFFNSIWIPPKI